MTIGTKPRRALTRVAAATSLATALLAAVFPVPVRAASQAWIVRTDPVRIMALGDSITAGVGPRGNDVGGGGYRGELERLLGASGYRFDLVGSRSDYSNGMLQRGHEGWPGYVIRSFPSDPGPPLLGDVTRRALETFHPDVVLLMAGTNDLIRHERGASGYSVGNIVASMDALLTQIFTEDPGVHVIVAGVVQSPRLSACAVARFDGIAGPPGCVSGIGPNLRALVARHAAAGDRITFAAGMDAAVPRDRDHFPDGIHPSGDGGYDAMARVWMQAIEDQTLPAARAAVTAAAADARRSAPPIAVMPQNAIAPP